MPKVTNNWPPDHIVTNTSEAPASSSELICQNPPPRPVQLSRMAGWRMPPNTVSVARPTVFGNPFRPGGLIGMDMAVSLHRTWLEAETAEELGHTGSAAKLLNDRRAEVMRRLPELRGKNLACWCPCPAPYQRDRCHRAVLMEMANR